MLHAEGLFEKSLMVTITDITGKTVYQQHVTDFSNHLAIDATNLLKGMYVLTVQTNTGNMFVKFIAE
ncbi:MAG: T9SS type A sorting domain-containing protein [Bacteroidales bacterium]|nr:T9SS type A sorting domain-containing protein [Bacteroidales bacterium]